MIVYFWRIFLQVLKVLEVQMKIAAGGQLQAVANGGLQLVASLADQFRLEFVVRIGVRRADHMGDAVGDGHFRHLNGRFERVRAVVQTGKDVAMNIDHERSALVEDTRGVSADNSAVVTVTGE